MNKYTYKIAAVSIGYFTLVILLFTPLGHHSAFLALAILDKALLGLLLLALIVASILAVLKERKFAQRLLGVVVLFSFITWLVGHWNYSYLLQPPRLMQFADKYLIPKLNEYREEHGQFPVASPIWLPDGIFYKKYDGYNGFYILEVEQSSISEWTYHSLQGKWDLYEI